MAANTMSTSTTGTYTPFALAEEASLRYYRAGAPSETGRLWQAITNTN